MKIKFILTSQIATLLGKDEEVINLNNDANINNAVKKFLENKPNDLQKLIFKSDSELLPAILIIKNGNQIDINDNTILKDGDEIMIFSPMSGG